MSVVRPVPYQGEASYIFISYAHKDTEVVYPIIQAMIEAGLRVWFDEAIALGSEWDENIAAHVYDCDAMIAFITGNYLSSDNCLDELKYARELKKEQLLVYLEQVELPKGLAMRMMHKQALYWYKYSGQEESLSRLMQCEYILRNQFDKSVLDDGKDCDAVSQETKESDQEMIITGTVELNPTGDSTVGMPEYSVEDTPIEDMGFTVRTYNSLHRAKYTVSGELIHQSTEDLLKIRNMGMRGVREIRAWAEERGVCSIPVDGQNSRDTAERTLATVKTAQLPYQIGDTIHLGSYWTDIETKGSIEWVVLKRKNTQLLLVTRNAIEVLPFTNKSSASTAWKYSYIREWLNKVFYAEAFTADESSHIIRSVITFDPSDYAPDANAVPFSPKRDRVFLLSYGEAVELFSSDKDRIAVPTAYAAKKADMQKIRKCWLLRTNGATMSVVSAVDENGKLCTSGTRSMKFVRPAIWVTL